MRGLRLEGLGMRHGDKGMRGSGERGLAALSYCCALFALLLVLILRVLLLLLLYLQLLLQSSAMLCRNL